MYFRGIKLLNFEGETGPYVRIHMRETCVFLRKPPLKSQIQSIIVCFPGRCDESDPFSHQFRMLSLKRAKSMNRR